jgi:hypothetical protein
MLPYRIYAGLTLRITLKGHVTVTDAFNVAELEAKASASRENIKK